MEGFAFYIEWPNGVVYDTGLWLDPATSGKPRLRSMRTRRFQIGRMVAAMLLLPDPRREFTGTGEGEAIPVKKRYVVDRVGFGPETGIDSLSERVTIVPSFARLSNSLYTESIGVEWRWRRIQAVFEDRLRLPSPVADVLEQFQERMSGGYEINQDLTDIVAQIAKSVSSVDFGFSSDADPLPALEELVGLTVESEPRLPPPDELGEDEPEVSARSAFEYRMARMRQSSARRFALDVRRAYGHRCAFCGALLGGIPTIPSGVDAAHILAWSQYDLDVLPNGISLCKLHHWAFDAALMVPFKVEGKYIVRFTRMIDEFDPNTRSLLGTDGFPIPDDWLPDDEADRPSKKYLAQLYADLAIEFLD